MSLFGECYKKATDGYNKIQACIDSAENLQQLDCITNMVESWVGLSDYYCDKVYYDKTNKRRKKDADKLGDSIKCMFDYLEESFQTRAQELTPKNYEGCFKPVKIKGFRGMSENYTENIYMDDSCAEDDYINQEDDE